MMTTNGDSSRWVSERMTLLSHRISNRLRIPNGPERPHWIIGDPFGRRVELYRAEAKACGLPIPECVDWIDLIHHGGDALDPIPFGARLRVDSFGDRQKTIEALIQSGGGNCFPQRGEIRSLDKQYAGLCHALGTLKDWANRRLDVAFDQAPDDIVIMFDKWQTHHHVQPHRPQTILLPEAVEDLDQILIPFIDEVGGRAFIKPRFASSASGVCCYRVLSDRQQLIAPIEIVRSNGEVRLFNSLRVRSFTDPRDIHDIFRRLIPQGMIAEAAVNKARVDGDRFDLRVVVIDGQANHVVVRQSPFPMTNLHLGNQRGSLDAVVAAVGADRILNCRDLARLAASRFPKTRYCGVDILLPKRGEPMVCEVNAFGDFLPNLIVDGVSVYGAILRGNLTSLPTFSSPRGQA